MSEPRPFDSRPYRDQTYWGTNATLGDAQTRFYLGLAEEAGLTLRRIVFVPVAALAVDGTNYLTFKPFVSTVKDGTATVRYLDTTIATSTYALTADSPRRVHAKEVLNERLPKGALVGVDVAETGAVSSQYGTFQAYLIRASGKE